jgi:glycogen debranching enzyme
VQAYAYRAANDLAELLAAHGDPALAEQYTVLAQQLGERIHQHYWYQRDGQAMLALAIDGQGQHLRVNASNVGHVLAFAPDLLTPGQTAAVADQLGVMDVGYGLATAAPGSPGYGPHTYHRGSIWPHDTALAAMGLATAGRHDAAISLIKGLTTAWQQLGAVELFAGEPAAYDNRPLPYPHSCRPQAWSAASLGVLRARLGLRPHLPAGRLAIRPITGLVTQLTSTDLMLGSHRLSIELDSYGYVMNLATNAPVSIAIEPDPWHLARKI